MPTGDPPEEKWKLLVGHGKWIKGLTGGLFAQLLDEERGVETFQV